MISYVLFTVYFYVGCASFSSDSTLQNSSSPTKSFVENDPSEEDTFIDDTVNVESQNEHSISDAVEYCTDGVISPETVDLMIDLSQPDEEDDIYLTYARIEGIAELFEACSDPWGLFPTTYKHITGRGIEAIEDGEFEHPEWAEDIILDFAGRYLQNLQAVLTRGEPSWAWGRYYELADREDVSNTRSVMVAMSAHLLLDLPHSLATIGTTEAHKEDFFYFGDIMIEVSDDLIQDLRVVYDTDAEAILNGFFLGNWIDNAFGNETMITLSYQTIRTKSWNNRWYLQNNMGWIASAEIYSSFWTIDAVLRSLDGADIID